MQTATATTEKQVFEAEWTEDETRHGITSENRFMSRLVIESRDYYGTGAKKYGDFTTWMNGVIVNSSSAPAAQYDRFLSTMTKVA